MDRPIIDICRSCLCAGCDLSEKTVDQVTKEIILHKDKLRFCYPDMTFEEHTAYTLCLACCTLLENAYILKKQLLESQSGFKKRHIKKFASQPVANLVNVDKSHVNSPKTKNKRSKSKTPKSTEAKMDVEFEMANFLITEDINANECSLKSPPEELIIQLANVDSYNVVEAADVQGDVFIENAQIVQLCAEDANANSMVPNEYVIWDGEIFNEKVIDVDATDAIPNASNVELVCENDSAANQSPKKDIGEQEEFIEDLEIFYACTEEALEETLLNNTSSIVHQEVKNDNSDAEDAVDLLFKDYMELTNVDVDKELPSPNQSPEAKSDLNADATNDDDKIESEITEPLSETSKKNIPTGSKAHFCKYCGQFFTQPSSVVRHERLHEGVKPYSCKDCKKSFNQRCDLSLHERTHTGLRPYSCDQCDKTFLDAANLTKHRTIHSEVRPYVCKYCKKAFRLLSGLARHERVHTGEKPYACKLCRKAFRNFSSLNNHKKYHELPF